MENFLAGYNENILTEDYLLKQHPDTPENTCIRDYISAAFENDGKMIREEYVQYMNKVEEGCKQQQDQIKQEIKDNGSLKMFAGATDINRGDVNTLSTLRNLYNRLSEKRITLGEFQSALEQEFYSAFANEIHSIEGKKGIENIQQYEPEWRQIFGDHLESVLGNRKKAEEMFLVSWVEGSGFSHKTNSAHATGRFGIQLGIAQQIRPGTTENDLHDPIISAEIAAEYFKTILQDIQKKYPEKDSSSQIEFALLQYNGNFSLRIQEKYRSNMDQTFLAIYKELNWIRVCAGHKDGFKTIADIQTKLKQVHKKYYASGKSRGGAKYRDPNSTNTHFRVLDQINSGELVNIAEIPKMIEGYMEKVLLQQVMYPIQFRAIQGLYTQQLYASR